MSVFFNNVILWASIAFLVAFSAFFSSSETALASYNKIRMKKLAAEGNKRADRVVKLSDEYSRVLTGILIGNNIVNIAASTIGTLIFTSYFGAMGAGISTIFLTIILLIFGEIIPKTLANDKAETVCMKNAAGMQFFVFLFGPLIFVFDKLKSFVNRIDKSDKQPIITEQELKFMIEEIEDQGVLEDRESELVRSALDLDEVTASEVMTPRVDLVSVEVNEKVEKIKSVFLNERYSRLPVYEKQIDNVIGVLSEKDFFREYFSEKDFNIRNMLKKNLLIPPKTNIFELMKKFQQGKTHMAVVVDQYGGIEGVITLEDILEKLIGNIYDEKDSKKSCVIKLGDNTWWIDPDISVYEMYKEVCDGEFMGKTASNTVGGWVLENLEKLPNEGDAFCFDNLEVSVSEMEDKRIVGVTIKKHDNDQSS